MLGVANIYVDCSICAIIERQMRNRTNQKSGKNNFKTIVGQSLMVLRGVFSSSFK